MGYGSMSGKPYEARSLDVMAPPTTRVIQMPTHRNTATERSPLIIRRRQVRRRTSADALLNWRIVTLLLMLVGGVLIGIHLLVIEYNEWPVNYPFHLIDRSFWYRGQPIDTLNLTLLNSSQVSNVVLFHTRGNYCHNFRTCLFVISEMQNQNFSEIPFNFLIGGDGKTYELRGWNYRSGFEKLPFNDECMAVGLIGNFTVKEPAINQVHEVEAFISESIRRRKLTKDYKIHGARLHEKDGHKMFTKFKTLTQWAGWI